MLVTPLLEDASLIGADRLAPLSERSLSKLRWRSRRGLLENDLFIERFFNRYQKALTVRQAKGLDDLMELSDNDLMDLFLQRKRPEELEAESASTPEAREVLALCIVSH